MSLFDGIFTPPTPEQRAAWERSLLTKTKAALPLVQEARRALREVRALGFDHCHEDLYRAQKYLALLEDGIENILAAPSRLDE